MEMEDNNELLDKYPRHWSIVPDKSYQGETSFLTHKRPARINVSPQQEAYNKTISTDRIVVEKYFGRIPSL